MNEEKTMVKPTTRKLVPRRYNNPRSIGKRPLPINKNRERAKDDRNPVKIMALGGLGEFGRNMFVIEYKNECIIVDMGLRFPEENMPGVDFIIPSIEYFTNNKNLKILGVFISHAHYDHLGAVPYLISKLNYPPIYTTPLTKEIILKRQDEFNNMKKLDIRIVDADKNNRIEFANFIISVFHVNHNVPDSVGFLIETKQGNIMYTGDYKIDFNPIFDRPADLTRIVKLASLGVDLLLADSTGIEQEGHSISEQEIFQNLEIIFMRAQGRIILATFASLISRLQQAIVLAEKFNRKVVINGFSMKTNLAIAKKLGYVKSEFKTIIDVKEMHRYKPEELLILTTGAQGEDNAGLMKIINKENKNIRIQPGDTMIFSSSVIPGNEMAVQCLKDSLTKQGANIYHYKMLDIHASGHAHKEDIKMMLNLIKPQQMMPVHGFYYMQKLFNDLAQDVLKLHKENCLLVSNGQVVEMTRGKAVITSKFVPANYVMVDGLGVGDVGEIVLRDRQALSQDGMFIINLIIDRKNKDIKVLEIISRGFIFMKDSNELIKNTKEKVTQIIHKNIQKVSQENLNEAYIRNVLRDEIGLFLFQKTERRPMIIPIVMEM
ncbi:MAG TPA: ribonuclease J [Candidatus Paceibacterota bacterium]|nr:ribonuclease J [Candidatus Paceibacterota bacterium]